MANILSETNWQGTRVYDKDKNDLTKENANFIGLAKYDAKSGRYEFLMLKQVQVVVIKALSLSQMMEEENINFRINEVSSCR